MPFFRRAQSKSLGRVVPATRNNTGEHRHRGSIFIFCMLVWVLFGFFSAFILYSFAHFPLCFLVFALGRDWTMAADEYPDIIHIHSVWESVVDPRVKSTTKVAPEAVWSFLLPIPPPRLPPSSACLFPLNYLWKSLHSLEPSSFPQDLGL